MLAEDEVLVSSLTNCGDVAKTEKEMLQMDHTLDQSTEPTDWSNYIWMSEDTYLELLKIVTLIIINNKE
jgi:hypothetical protein